MAIELSENNLPDAVRRALYILSSHPHVHGITISHTSEICVELTVSVIVNIPIRYRAAGVTDTGVYPLEDVTLLFLPSFPASAPKVYLRDNFNRSLAHIFPSDADKLVKPCYIDGSPTDLYLQQGIGGLFDQIVVWLEKAAANTLIDLEQGWEPVRRDNLKDLIFADTQHLRSLVTFRGSYKILPTNFFKISVEENHPTASKKYLLCGWVGHELIKLNKSNIKKHCTEPGDTITVLLSPPASMNGKPCVCDTYLPETVTNFSDAAKRAELYGLANVFTKAFADLEMALSRLSTNYAIPIVVIMVVRRPVHIIGEESDLELIPYVLDITAPLNVAESSGKKVSPAALYERISPSLLASVSGLELPKVDPYALIGCGSLGSKLAIHLTRAGMAPRRIMDNDRLSSHNAARHALIPDSTLIDYGSELKVTELAKAIEKFNQKVIPIDASAISLLDDINLRKRLCPKNTFAIINASASLAVRATLSKVPIQARIIETSLYTEGSLAVMTLEGPERNPCSADLMLSLYTECLYDDWLRHRLFSEQGRSERIRIGIGCGSLSMRVSDAKISLSAASMANKLADWRSAGTLPSNSEVYVGAVGDNNMDITWKLYVYGKYETIPVLNDSNWNIKISGTVIQKINRECAQYSQVETGGLLIGAVCEIQNTVTITDVVEAPEDSIRSPSEFNLGINGLHAAIDQIVSKTNHSIYCLGTWHSHLLETGPSQKDYDTANIISNRTPTPQIMLVRTPSKFQGLTINTI